MTTVTEVQAARRVLPLSIGQALADSFVAEREAYSARGAAADQLIALVDNPVDLCEWLLSPQGNAKKGIPNRSSDIIRVDGKDDTRGEFFAEMKWWMAQADTEEDKELLAKPITSLSDADKKRRKYAQQQHGSRLRDVRDAVICRLSPADMAKVIAADKARKAAGKKGDPKKAEETKGETIAGAESDAGKSDGQKVTERLVSAVGILQRHDRDEIKDLNKIVKHIQNALKLLAEYMPEQEDDGSNGL